MNIKCILVLSSLLLLFSGCENSTNKSNLPQNAPMNHALETKSLKENIGWIHGTCLAIKNGNIKPGTAIQMVVLSDPQRIVATTTMGVTNSNSECSALLGDRAEMNKEDGRFFYDLNVKEETPNIMAVGLVSATEMAKNLNSIIELDLNSDGIAEHVNMCLTHEGVQFYISASPGFDEKALWSDYYYLGYDNTPSCPEQ